jgi:hypothetical protein
MQNAAADGIEIGREDRNDARRAVVSDLVSPIAHVQTSLRLIELAITGEQSLSSQESSANLIVLDDVSPRYMRAAAALQTCDANLGAALHSLLDSDVRCICRNSAGVLGRQNPSGPRTEQRYRPQLIISSAFDDAPRRFLVCLPRRK